MKKEKISIFIIIFVIVLAVSLSIYEFSKTKIYTLDISSDNLEYIICEKNNGEITTFNDRDKIEKFIEKIKKNNLETTTASLHDYPINTEDIVTINLNNSDGDVTIFYFYKRKNNYYFEQPYNGIYKVDKQEAKDIIELISKYRNN